MRLKKFKVIANFYRTLSTFIYDEVGMMKLPSKADPSSNALSIFILNSPLQAKNT